MDQIERRKFQIEALERLYLAERNRKETVRSSLAIPLAALTFASFGFGALVANAGWYTDTLVSLILSLGIGALSIGAVAFFLKATQRLRDFNYDTQPIDPSVFQFTENAAVIEDELTMMGVEDAELANTAIRGAMEDLCEEYRLCHEELAQENAVNLSIQKSVFDDLLTGLSMLIVAIFVLGALKTAHEFAEPVTRGEVSNMLTK